MSAPVNLHDVPGRIARSNGALATALGQWARRDDSKAQPEVTRAGHTAVEAIDAMLAELHRARQQLVGEIRQADNAAMARADALLARYRDGAARVDSESWTCRACGCQFIGRRPEGDRCRDCAGGAQ
jgi:rubrerythrin